ncbi:Serine/threonine-protein kinase PknD [compost metagenome]
MARGGLPMRLTRPIQIVLAALLMALVTACPRPLSIVPTSDSLLEAQGEQVSGQVDFGALSLQATISDDVAPGATISLIEVASGQTLSTTRTDPDGKFILKYTNGFKPVTGALYYFEAVKGLKGLEGKPNAVGTDVVRVRTIASYRRGGWVTLTSDRVTSSLLINPMTTALSIVVSLRLGTAKPVDPETLFGAIRPGVPQGAFPDTLKLPDPVLVPLTMVQDAYTLVTESLASERDPVRWIALDSVNLNRVLLPEVPFSISFLRPRKQVVGEELELVGSNFARNPEDNLVQFAADGNQRVSTTIVGTVSPDLRSLKVKVPPGAISGPIYLTIDGKTVMSDPENSFQLDIRDGHSVVRTMQGITYLFVANRDMNTVSRISPAGEVIPFLTTTTHPELLSPQALTFGPDEALYIACGGTTKKVLRIPFDPSGNPLAATAYSGAIATPAGIAFGPSGDLFVSDTGAPNRIYKVASSSTPVTVPQATTGMALTGVALNKPRGLAFGSDSALYVANSASNNVLKIVTDTGASSEFLSGLSSPWSIAFDSQGHLYVSNNSGNSIYRRDASTAQVSAFASLPNPGGLDADPSGYIYCADNVSNQIYLVNSRGDSRLLGTGLSSPMGIHVDAEGIFVLTEAGRILKINHADKALSIFADGLSEGRDLYRDSAKNFYVYHPSLNRVTRLTPTGLIDSYIPVTDVTDIFVSGTKLYLKKSYTLTPDAVRTSHGGVEIRDLSTSSSWHAVASSQQAYVRDPIGIAFDNSNGAVSNFRHGLYVAHHTDGSIVKMDKNLRFTPFLDRSNAPELVQPYDVWVDPTTANVWVSVHGLGNGVANKAGLYVYSPAGLRLKDFSTAITRPCKFGFDGTTLFLADYYGNKVLKLDRNIDNPAWAATTHYAITTPRALAFDTATQTMYIGGNGTIYKVPNYLAPTPASHTTYHSFNATDLHFHTDGYLYAVNGYSYKIEKNGSTRYEYRKSRGSLSDFARRDDGVIWHSDRNGRLSPWTHDWDAQQWGGMQSYSTGGGIGTDGSGNWVSVNRITCGQQLISVGWTNGTQTTPHFFGKDHCTEPLAEIVHDGGSKVFILVNPGGRLLRYDTASGGLTLLARKYGNPDFSHGISVYQNVVYQTIKTRHRIDLYDANGAAGEAGGATPAYQGDLKVGLVAPEL